MQTLFSFQSCQNLFRDRKFNAFIIFVILSGCIFNGFICLIWNQKGHLLSLFLILVKAFFEFLNLLSNWMYVLLDNGNIDVFSIHRFDYPTRSFINRIISSVNNILKIFIKHIFRINHCLSRIIKTNRSKFYVPIFIVFAQIKLLPWFDNYSL